jgi:hypothetical protein
MSMAGPQSQVLFGCNESSVTQSVKLLLADSCEVIERTNFAEFIREASARGFDLVIPYGNCLSPPTLCSGGLLENTKLAIKGIKVARDVPIIALTSMTEWCEPLVAAGADVCLTTPFDAVEFKHAVSKCLSVDRSG